MPVSFAPSVTDMLRFAPETILTIAGTLLMVLDPLFAKKYPKLFGHQFHFAGGDFGILRARRTRPNLARHTDDAFAAQRRRTLK